MLQQTPRKKTNSFSEEEIEEWKSRTLWTNPCDRQKGQAPDVDNLTWQQINHLTMANKVKEHFSRNRYLLVSKIDNPTLSKNVRKYCEKQVQAGLMIKEKLKVDYSKVPIVAYRMA